MLAVVIPRFGAANAVRISVQDCSSSCAYTMAPTGLESVLSYVTVMRHSGRAP